MRVQTDAARMLVYRAGFLKDQGRPSTTETSIAKLYATEAAQNCAHLAIQVHGGSGYVDDHPVERYYRDVRVTTLYEGTSQIQKLIIGRAETGHQRARSRLVIVGVLGAGTMGAGIAQLAAASGADTLLARPGQGRAASAARGRSGKRLAREVEKGRLEAGAAGMVEAAEDARAS